MGFTNRVRRSSNWFGFHARVTIRRVLIAAVILLALGHWITGQWLWWLAIIPATVGLWWLWRVLRDVGRYARGRYWWEPPPWSRR
jgi:hypothetical protein